MEGTHAATSDAEFAPVCNALYAPTMTPASTAARAFWLRLLIFSKNPRKGRRHSSFEEFAMDVDRVLLGKQKK